MRLQILFSVCGDEPKPIIKRTVKNEIKNRQNDLISLLVFSITFNFILISC